MSTPRPSTYTCSCPHHPEVHHAEVAAIQDQDEVLYAATFPPAYSATPPTVHVTREAGDAERRMPAVQSDIAMAIKSNVNANANATATGTTPTPDYDPATVIADEPAICACTSACTCAQTHASLLASQAAVRAQLAHLTGRVDTNSTLHLLIVTFVCMVWAAQVMGLLG
ncbi:hypothetical protein BDV95DRAFT_622530 [Massariosphaeria phaeospora]|uniref:Uncharacterized protein n=1 Tax=Massariosphaeria phaeospora TaxID=100035 RepID=A0A7C8M3W6_9PLEO|nr:hypothetical protein BDV95DRAFT_622530 [Massariosphaeria phaeospora]